MDQEPSLLPMLEKVHIVQQVQLGIDKDELFFLDDLLLHLECSRDQIPIPWLSTSIHHLDSCPKDSLTEGRISDPDESLFFLGI